MVFVAGAQPVDRVIVLREQARSHIRYSVSTDFVYDNDQVWERACSRRGPHIQHKFNYPETLTV